MKKLLILFAVLTVIVVTFLNPSFATAECRATMGVCARNWGIMCSTLDEAKAACEAAKWTPNPGCTMRCNVQGETVGIVTLALHCGNWAWGYGCWAFEQRCDLHVDSLSGSSLTIDPDAGGSVTITGSISGTSGYPITWTLSHPGGSESGTGSFATATWDGKISGKFAEPGSYEATLTAQNTCGSTDKKTVDITVERTDDCKLNITFSSTANAASGNLSHSQALFTTKGTGLSTNMTLYYNSLDPYSGPLGIGWTHSYDIAVRENDDGSVVQREGDGARRLYRGSGNGYTSQAGDYSTLAKNTDGTFVKTNPDGRTYNFGQDGKITSIVDRNGNAMTFGYTSGNLTTIGDPAGRTTTISYDADKHITSITDPGGSVYSFTVTSNLLTSVAYPGNGTWFYTYDADSFINTKTDPNGNTTTYAYDDQHRVASSLAADGSTRLISYPTGDDTTKTTTFTETDGSLWQYTYDTQAGTLTQKTDPQGGVTSYTYDGNRNTTSRTDPDGSATTYTYDASGNTASVTDALGQTTSYTYNSFGQATSTTDSDGNTTTNSYDEKGNLISTTDAAGATTSYEYDTQGHVTKMTNPASQSTTYTYDLNGNLSSVTGPTGAASSFTYDAAGNVTSQTDANGSTTRFEYDGNNRLIKVTDPAGNVTTLGYDNNGNRTSQTDANGNITYYEYNSKNQLIKVKDALGNVTTYTYGGSGCSSCGGGGGTDKLTSITDAKGNTTTYQYDSLGRIMKETDPLGNSISYAYDSKGNLTSKTDANGATITYTHDSLGRLLTKNYPDNSTESFTYDAKGNILTATNANISYTFSHDAGGRITSVTDSNSRTASYAYNTLGGKKKTTYPDGSAVSYNYDTAGRLASVVNGGGRTYSYQYDSLGRRSKLIYPNGVTTSYSYDNASRLTNLSTRTSQLETINLYSYTHDKVGNRLSKTETDISYAYGYDKIYRLLQSLPTKQNGKDKEQENKTEAFSYDAAGNRLTGPGRKDTYAYNPGNQLLSDPKHQYEYDRNGNLTKKTERDDNDDVTVWTYSYDYENRLVKALKQEDREIVTVSFRYDPFGRRIEKKVEETETEGGEAETKTYVYDNEDVILEYLTKSEDGSTKTEATRYIHGPGIDEPLAIERKGEVYYYHADGLGSITALTDKKQKVVESYTYSSFGEVKRHGEKVKNAFTFMGREWDKEAGLYYFRNRYQDSVTGRFISSDPSLKVQGSPAIPYALSTFLKNPQKLNSYLYALDNPQRFVDPFGLDVKDCFRSVNSPMWPWLDHRYLWIDGEGWGLTTADDSAGFTTTPGRLEQDNATSGWGVHCTTVPVSECKKQCLKNEINKDYANPPNYNLWSDNCQTWVSDIFNRCSNQ